MKKIFLMVVIALGFASCDAPDVINNIIVVVPSATDTDDNEGSGTTSIDFSFRAEGTVQFVNGELNVYGDDFILYILPTIYVEGAKFCVWYSFVPTGATWDIKPQGTYWNYIPHLGKGKSEILKAVYQDASGKDLSVTKSIKINYK